MTFDWNIVTDFRVMWQYSFFRNAFIAGTMIAVVAGIIGYLVVLRRAAFATHALGHTGFSGAAGAVLVGVNPVYGLLLFTMTTGTGIALLGPRAANRDVEIGTVLAFALGIGRLLAVVLCKRCFLRGRTVRWVRLLRPVGRRDRELFRWTRVSGSAGNGL